MQTANEMSAVIGQTMDLQSGALMFTVKVLDCRKVWNRVDCLVEPVAGTGRTWVAADRLHKHPNAEGLLAGSL